MNESKAVEHLAAMLRHCDDQRLLDLTRHSVGIAKAEAGYSAKRAETCERECERRGIHGLIVNPQRR